MTAELANAITTTIAAREAFEDHFIGCRTCGTGGRLCAAGNRLHTVYATAKVNLNRR